MTDTVKLPSPSARLHELARLLAEGKKQAASPLVNFKMVKQGELQFDFTITPELTQAELFRMIDDGLAGSERILKAATNGGSK